MAWNKIENKAPVPQGAKVLSPGAPIAYFPNAGNEPYHDAWDMRRAFEEGVRTVTWVYRCVDVIAGNQAKLPMVVHRGNDATGELLRKDPLLKVLNYKANIAEPAFFFRKRVSQQLLIGTRGAFIEVVRDRSGGVSALHLLPPELTAPVPDPKTFVKYFETELPDGTKYQIEPEKVIWIRNPHPIDPYLSLTPLEAAGIAVEIENLARIYNRNFLQNDGRGGGLLVLNGEIEEDDRRELQSRFGGGPSKSGTTTVIASDDGASYFDLGSSPRDASYTEMRKITKEEILAAFGVPESVIGNASGRCLRRTELVRLASGERIEAGKLVDQRFTLLTATPDGFIEVPAWATQEQHETIYRTTTESGRTLDTNGRHPLYAARHAGADDLLEQGWTPVSELTLGHVVAVPSYIAPANVSDITVDEAFMLGAFVGHGARHPVGIEDLLRRVGLLGATNHTKFVPEEVFMASREAIAAFLSSYFSADGHVSVGLQGQSPESEGISVTTTSEQLAKDVQELLLRIGVNASVDSKQLGDRIFFGVGFSSVEDIINFTDHVEIPGGVEARSWAEGLLPGDAAQRWRTRDLHPNLRWERIKGVEVLEADDTVGIAVPGHHTYLSTFWEHNTFSNAAEEGRVFWMETMSPHLQTIARSFDMIEEANYVDFDTSGVPILILSEQDRQQYVMREFENGLISANEYRGNTNKKLVESELADALLVNPNLTAIANTEKPFEETQAGQAVQGDPQLQNAPLDVQRGETPVLEFPDDVPTDGSGAQELADREDVPNFDEIEGFDPEDFKEAGQVLRTKSLGSRMELETKVASDTERWEEITGSAVDRFLERQERVVTEKATGKKAREALQVSALTVGDVFNQEVWDRQIEDDLRPIIQGIVFDAMSQVSAKTGVVSTTDDPEVQEFVDLQTDHAKKTNEHLQEELANAILVANAFNDETEGGGSKAAMLAVVIGAIYAKARTERRDLLVKEQALTAYNAGLYFAARQSGVGHKLWLARKDAKVRAAHLELDGEKVALAEGFMVDGHVLRFPKDPLAPPHLTINCRCTLWFL